MKLGDLRQALAKLPPDMNDMQVVIVYASDKKMQIELVAFTGYIPLPGAECIAVGAVSEVKRRVESGQMSPPDGYGDIEDSI
jgi:hypothetical protein